MTTANSTLSSDISTKDHAMPLAASPVSVASSNEEKPHFEYKTEIAARLAEAVKSAPKVNRSADLVPLTHSYETMRKSFKQLIGVAKAYREATEKMNESRGELAKEFARMSEDSPISSPVRTVVDVHKLASKDVEKFCRAFDEKVIDYCTEWDEVVTSQVNRDIKEANKLHEDLGHYERKVEKLRLNANDLSEKDKSPSKSKEEKLRRNEKKLSNAWQLYEGTASTLCHLLEQATQHGWKDLYPLIKQYITAEAERACNEKDNMSKLCDLNDEFDNIATTTNDTDKSTVPVAQEES